MTAVVTPQPFQPGFRLIDGTDLNNNFSQCIVSSQDGITAGAGGTQALAYPLTAVISRVTTVASAADSVKLPPSKAGLEIVVINSAAINAMQVFGSGTDTINGVAYATGISQAAGIAFTYTCTTLGAWIQNASVNSGGYTGTFDGVVGGVTPAAGTFTAIHQAPIAAGATTTLTAASASKTVLLNTAAGSVVTLPAATGTGNIFRFATTVTTTSAKHAVLAVGTDYLIGMVNGVRTTALTPFLALAGSVYQSLQMPFAGSQPSGGIQGDWFEIQDVASGLWEVKGQFSAGTTATTPFSTATS